MKDTGVQDLSPESCNKPSGDIFVFRYLFCRKKAWYTEQNNLEFVEKNPMKKRIVPVAERSTIGQVCQT